MGIHSPPHWTDFFLYLLMAVIWPPGPPSLWQTWCYVVSLVPHAKTQAAPATRGHGLHITLRQQPLLALHPTGHHYLPISTQRQHCERTLLFKAQHPWPTKLYWPCTRHFPGRLLIEPKTSPLIIFVRFSYFSVFSIKNKLVQHALNTNIAGYK